MLAIMCRRVGLREPDVPIRDNCSRSPLLALGSAVRVAVLDRVTAARQPLGAPEIIRRLGEETDPVTVYRTLNTLAEHKLVHRIRGEDGAWRYAASPVAASPDDRREHPHAHFVCD